MGKCIGYLDNTKYIRNILFGYVFVNVFVTISINIIRVKSVHMYIYLTHISSIVQSQGKCTALLLATNSSPIIEATLLPADPFPTA